MGRQAKGVRLIRLDADQKLSSVVAFEEEQQPNDDGSETPSNSNRPTFKLEASENDTVMVMLEANTNDVDMSSDDQEFEDFQVHVAGSDEEFMGDKPLDEDSIIEF